MEQNKLQQLHDTIMKLVPRGKHGGLGLSKFAGKGRSESAHSEDNPLYRYFVRAGEGQRHRRDFNSDDETEAGEAPVEVANKEKKRKKERRQREAVDDAEEDGEDRPSSLAKEKKLKKEPKD